MKFGTLFAILGTAIGLTVMVTAFLTNASPYVNVAQARQVAGDNLHLAGDIVPGTLRPKPREGIVEFTLKDERGALMPVVYRGNPPGNMGTATKVVAIGGVNEGRFEASKLLLKCPSKYETAPGAKPAMTVPGAPVTPRQANGVPGPMNLSDPATPPTRASAEGY